MVRAADRASRPARASVWLEEKAPRRRNHSHSQAQAPAEARTAVRAPGEGQGEGPGSGSGPGGLDRDRITAATVRLLDAEGLARFSMRRLAAELNVTAMSVYWYVDTKDDLLELALDAAFGELALPDPEDDTADWRDQLRALATGYRALLVRHPWVSPLAGTFLNIGPHAMAFSLCVQQVMRRTGLPPHGRMGGLSAVFQFVYGFGTIEGHFVQRCAAAGVSQDEYFRDAMGTIREEPRFARHFASATDLMEARGGDTVEEMRERDFTFALELLIAGIEAMSSRSGPAAS
ncbi:TetR/AcrR family transcriptional regulator [Streptomyces sp. GC420]|uniref:TetR/AcrR family transcriptional regulator n=1 Tax=Streptomyces sp. GC420 TaxID=2697568 RepID=UPI001414D493|nr:TetR/AcrR family transcriptional regulator [Streptomyces sp. GC420]NBM16444.1 TetR family transcriptional regulator [Streptomyces sp. GC420]